MIKSIHYGFKLPLSTGQSWWSTSWHDTALELQMSWVRIPPEQYADDFRNRTQESSELTHIDVYG